MNITKAKTAGFCFGVQRAVDMTYKLVDQGKKVATMGELIHNKQLVADLEKNGVITLNSTQVPQGFDVVIRSHGVEKGIYEELCEKGVNIHDATCPYVKKIHHLVQELSQKGRTILIAGDSTHPEVQGIISYCEGEVFVFNEPQELESWGKTGQNNQKPLALVAQTTYML
ncbi:MAG: bifunctional 4-hydroxy-3-methylbut-2-enyl diphosphate reductase/30S ribosomal protein S1, partial [Oscillospiraceae bacterium]